MKKAFSFEEASNNIVPLPEGSRRTTSPLSQGLSFERIWKLTWSTESGLIVPE
jgi:hypothetical protein